MTYRLWSAAEDAELRRIVGERKWSDTDIAYIMGRNRKTVRLHREALGLPIAAQKPARGWRHTAEARARIAAGRRTRWQDPEFRARMKSHLMVATASSLRARFKPPPRGTSEGRQYIKLRRALGVEAARASIGAG